MRNLQVINKHDVHARPVIVQGGTNALAMALGFVLPDGQTLESWLIANTGRHIVISAHEIGGEIGCVEVRG